MIDSRSIMLPAVSLLSRAPAAAVLRGASPAAEAALDQPERDQQHLVDPLGRIVARLVVAVDVALVGGDLGIGDAACGGQDPPRPRAGC